MFSLPHFIRRTPSGQLRSYFKNQHQIDPELDWDSDKRELHAALLSFVQQLPRREGEQVYADFEQVDQLCDEVGQRALRAMVLDGLAEFDELDGNEARGLSMLVGNPSGFRHALSLAYSERLHHGRSWGRYYVSRPGQPSEEQTAMSAFEAELRDLFVEFDGSGRKIMIECFERPGQTAPSLIYSIFVESLPQSIIEFDDIGPQRTTRRPVIEAVVCYNPSEGTIDRGRPGTQWGKPLFTIS